LLVALPFDSALRSYTDASQQPLGERMSDLNKLSIWLSVLATVTNLATLAYWWFQA